MHSKYKSVFRHAEIAQPTTAALRRRWSSQATTLWDLLTRCIDLLELDLNISDWMDLYADGMSESLSPLRQVYVNMDRLH